MKPWHEVIVPHKDIRADNFDESVFAADLSDVVADRGPLEYRDPEIFFRKTYPTQGLVNLLAAIAARLASKGGGEAVIQIQTPFGGGKTHSLIALYHLFKGGRTEPAAEFIAKVREKAGVEAIPEAQVVTFTGTAADPLGKTPWGEIAEQLGNYALVAEHDSKRRSPGKDLLAELLADKPTLLLMDEVAEYVVKAKDFTEQVIAFFQELTDTVKVLPKCVLVVTLPSSAPYGEEGERALHQLQQVFGRVEAICTPVEGEEIYEIIRRRLFEGAPDPAEVHRVAESYWQLYQELGDDVPREVREPAYREKLRKAYPFHPELIDLLFERWSTFSTFQRTRGVLRLLAEVVGDLYKRQHGTPLIQPAHINLANSTIRRELLKHIGNEYEGVIAADIANGNAKAQKIDREMGSEYVLFRVASGLATTIFFGSFSGSEKKGLGIQRLRVGVLRAGIPPALVGDALRRLAEELWYLHVEGGVYSFSNQPNLNRVIVEREEQVGDELIREEIRSRLEELVGKDLPVTLWPKVSQDVPDTKELKLAILSPEYTRQNGATDAFVKELVEKSGTTFRTYKNTMLVLAADEGELANLRQRIKRFLALRAIRDDKALMRRLSEENKKTLESKWKDLDSAIPSVLLSVYRHLAKPGESGVEWFDLGIPIVGEKGSLAARVREYLKNQELLLERISSVHLLKKALREDEQEKPVTEIADMFLRYPQLPMLKSRDVIEQAISEGVRDGVFAVKIGDRVYYKEAPPASLLTPEAVLLRKELVPQPTAVAEAPTLALQSAPHAQAEAQPGLAGVPAAPGGGAGPQAQPSAATSPEAGKQRVRLRVKVPWDKLSDFVRGVITPLRSDGAELEVEVYVEARAESGAIKPGTFEHKVKETLHQINAEVVEESLD
jgi:predicted AAA+ superfamily ATPase